MSERLYIFDTTLRDGEQVPGCQLNTTEKIEVAKLLENLGVDVIEAGFPISSPGDFNSVLEISKAVSEPTICALTRAVEKDIDVAADALRLARHKRIHTGIGVSPQHIYDKLRSTPEKILERAVAAAINSEYLQNEAADVKEYPGNLMLVHGIVSKYLRHGVVAYDAAHDGFRVEGLERPVEDSFPFVSAGRELRVRFGGIADRIDRLDDGRLRVVDYKTGESQLEFAGVEALFNGEAKQRQSNVLQTLLYAMMLTHSEGCEAVPALYYVRRMNRPDYSPELVDRSTSGVGEGYSAYAVDFERLLGEKLAELFDPAVPFRATDDAEHTCRYCDYRQICRR